MQALESLKAGNARFVSSDQQKLTAIESRRRPNGAMDQRPLAIVIGCSDSRVPVELIFDQGLGDLFVIRIAGNIVAPSQIGSVEFAAEKFNTRLAVVLGHTHCGAIRATLDELLQPSADQSPNLHSIVQRIQPALESLLKTHPRANREELESKAVRANIRQSVHKLKHGSKILEELVEKKHLQIVGAEYCLESGVVDFFADVPESE